MNPAKLSQYLFNKFLMWTNPVTPAGETPPTPGTSTPASSSTTNTTTNPNLALKNALRLLWILSPSSEEIEIDLIEGFEEFKKVAFTNCGNFRDLPEDFFNFANALPDVERERIFTEIFYVNYNLPGASTLNKYNALYYAVQEINKMLSNQLQFDPTTSLNTEDNVYGGFDSSFIEDDLQLNQAIANSLADAGNQSFSSSSSTSSSSSSSYIPTTPVTAPVPSIYSTSSSSNSSESLVTQQSNSLPTIPSTTTTATTATTATTSSASASATISNENLNSSVPTMIFTSPEEERFEKRINGFIPRLFGTNSETNDAIKVLLKNKWSSYKSQYTALSAYETKFKKNSHPFSLESLTEFLESYQPAEALSAEKPGEKRKTDDSQIKQQQTTKRGKR